MSKTGLRKIKIAGETYLWKVGHYHLQEFKFSECADKVTIYLEGYKNAPLILHFRLEDNILLSKKGNNEDHWFIDWGCFMKGKKVINLSRPAVIAKLIKHYIQQDWNPEKDTRPFEVQDALKLLEELKLPESSCC